MKLFKHSRLDVLPALLSVGQLGVTLVLAARWEHAGWVERLAQLPLLTLMMTYNIVVLSHFFTHNPWFEVRWLNSATSALNSLNTGQSIQAYAFFHVRNHHRYNNDRKGPDGKTKDHGSTYRSGENGEHDTLFRYAFVGALYTGRSIARALLTVTRLFRVGEEEHTIRSLASKSASRLAEELRQIQLDRAAHFAGLVLFFAISWRWTLLCYLPAYGLSLALEAMQSYYEHYGANPDSRYTDSVSCYSPLYNALAFNDGYHQEHHLRPQTHWSRLPEVKRQHAVMLSQVTRVISPVPAILGFLHRSRPLLHRVPVSAPPRVRNTIVVSPRERPAPVTPLPPSPDAPPPA